MFILRNRKKKKKVTKMEIRVKEVLMESSEDVRAKWN